MWIEGKIKSVYGGITKSEKVIFVTAMIAGILAHLYAFTNTIPNFDGVGRMYDEQQMTISGRWFLHDASRMNGFTQMPMVLGVFAVFFLALTGMLIVRLFEMRSPLLAALFGAMLVVFPPVADTITYIYTAPAYFLSAFLATLSVWAVRRKGWGMALGVLLLSFSMGIYQTYVTLAIGLCLCLVIRDLTCAEKKVKEIWKTGLGYMAYLALGAGSYYLILKLVLWKKDLQLLSYLGMNQVDEGYSLRKLPGILAKTYGQVGAFFFGQDGVNGWPGKIFHGCLLLLILLLLLRICKEQHLTKEGIRLAGLVLMLVLLPLGANFMQVLNPYTEPRLIMKLSYALFYLLPLVLLERLPEKEAEGALSKGAALVVTCGLLLVTVQDWEYDNTLYTMLHQAHRTTLSFVTNVLSRVESCEGYEYGMPVVIVGGFPRDRYYATVPVYDKVKSSSALPESVIPLNKHIYQYMNDWLNVPIERPEEAVFLEVAETEAFAAMPRYPDEGSVQILDGRVVVKMQDTYTPMSDYEKEYEKRR